MKRRDHAARAKMRRARKAKTAAAAPSRGERARARAQAPRKSGDSAPLGARGTSTTMQLICDHCGLTASEIDFDAEAEEQMVAAIGAISVILCAHCVEQREDGEAY